jgi:2-polyprenyl-3-methyl-5-hydroxy-6-metoxy-1,4-benzoquinol methylase
MPSSLAHRDRVPELMDEPGLDPAAHRAALRGLARINAVSRSAEILWPAIARLPRPIRVLDVATGGGDVPTRLLAKAARAGVPLQVDGCDISATALAHAAERAGDSVRLFQHDVARDPLPTGYDVVTASLFLHHLPDDDAATVLRRMREAAGRLVLVNDLERGRAAWLLAWAGCRLLTRSPIVHFDGPASVRSAFTVAEVKQLADRSGLTGATVTRHWPYRFLLSWSRG